MVLQNYKSWGGYNYEDGTSFLFMKVNLYIMV